MSLQSFLHILPKELTWEIFEFSIKKCSDVSSLATLSKGASDTVVDMVADENCAVWETLFKLSHSSLHEAMKESNDTRTTWQARLQALVSMTAQSKSEAHEILTPQIEKKKRRFSLAMSKWFRPEKKNEEALQTFDICFYNHPVDGLQVNIGKLNRAVFLYAVRRPAHQVEQTFAEKVLAPYQISIIDQDTRTISSQTRLPLVLASINGREVASFKDYRHILKFIGAMKKQSDFIFWRFLKPNQRNWERYWEVRHGVFGFPNECLLPAEPSTPTVGL